MTHPTTAPEEASRPPALVVEAPPPPALALVVPPADDAPPPLPTLAAPPPPALAPVVPPADDALPPLPALVLEPPPLPRLVVPPVAAALLWPPELVEPAAAPAAASPLPPVPSPLPSALEFAPLQEINQPAAPMIRIARPGNLCIRTPCGIGEACSFPEAEDNSFSVARGAENGPCAARRMTLRARMAQKSDTRAALVEPKCGVGAGAFLAERRTVC